jgi:hypothetical protein
MDSELASTQDKAMEREIQLKLKLKAADLKLAGRSYRQIGEALNRNHQTIKNWIGSPEVQQYINEQTRGGTITPPPKFDITSKDGRLASLQFLLDKYLMVMAERGANVAYQDVPGGTTGLVTKTGVADDKLLQTLLRAIDSAGKETGGFKEGPQTVIDCKVIVGIPEDCL